ncbi:MAG: hypothetical protein IT380_28760 [Myxococcales bacterium]|nr:hypothetical protein [Myxococcales bacterium]
MKTTLELPDDLLRRTKAEAALRGISMRDLVAEALERQLGTRPAPAWRRLAGKAKKLDTRPVKRAIAAEFSRVDKDTW